MAVPQKILPDTTVAQLVVDAGFTAERAVVAFCVLVAESGLNQYALNLVIKPVDAEDRRAHESLDMGIAQFNSFWHPEMSVQEAMDAEFSIQKFSAVSEAGADFTPWTAFNNLTFVRHVQRAYDAFQAIGVAV